MTSALVTVCGGEAQVIYKTTDEYAPNYEYGVRWDDPGWQSDGLVNRHCCPNVTGTGLCCKRPCNELTGGYRAPSCRPAAEGYALLVRADLASDRFRQGGGAVTSRATSSRSRM